MTERVSSEDIRGINRNNGRLLSEWEVDLAADLLDARAEIERINAELTAANIYKAEYVEADEAMGDGPSTKNTLAGNIRALKARPVGVDAWDSRIKWADACADAGNFWTYSDGWLTVWDSDANHVMLARLEGERVGGRWLSALAASEFVEACEELREAILHTPGYDGDTINHFLSLWDSIIPCPLEVARRPLPSGAAANPIRVCCCGECGPLEPEQPWGSVDELADAIRTATGFIEPDEWPEEAATVALSRPLPAQPTDAGSLAPLDGKQVSVTIRERGE